MKENAHYGSPCPDVLDLFTVTNTMHHDTALQGRVGHFSLLHFFLKDTWHLQVVVFFSLFFGFFKRKYLPLDIQITYRGNIYIDIVWKPLKLKNKPTGFVEGHFFSANIGWGGGGGGNPLNASFVIWLHVLSDLCTRWGAVALVWSLFAAHGWCIC